jgi:hypothetical protein
LSSGDSASNGDAGGLSRATAPSGFSKNVVDVVVTIS